MTTRPGTRTRRFALMVPLILSVALALSGCGPRGGLSDRYVAERLAWQTQKLRRAMRDNPELATDAMRETLADKYRRIVRLFPPPPGDPEALTDLERDVAVISGRSRLRLATMAVESGDPAEGIRLYSSVRDSYAFDRRMAIEGALALAGLHQAAGEWIKAVGVYEELTARWPAATETAGRPDMRILRAPVRVAAGYLLRGETAVAAESFERARDYYRATAEEAPGTPTAEAAARLAAETFELEGRWREAVAAYEEFDRSYGRHSNRAGVWLKLAELHETRLDRPDRAREYYLRVEDEYGDSVPGAAASIALSRLDIAGRRYQSARTRLEAVLSEFHDEETIAATATHHLAVSYELADQWDGAVTQFNTLAREYPTTTYGLSAPLHVADRYLRMGETVAAETALERAADHYERVARDYPSTPAELAALNYLIEVRSRQGKWREAAEALLETVGRFPQSEASSGLMLRAAEIYEIELGDREKARNVLESIRQTYPDGHAAAEAERRLEAFGG